MNIRSLVIALAAWSCASSAALAQNNLRLFFSTSNPGTLPTIPNPAPPDRPALPAPPELASSSNAVFNAGATTRLYLWGQAMDGASSVFWNGIGLNIDADGPVTLSNMTVFNPNSFFSGPSVNRWNAVSAGTSGGAGTEFNGVNMAAVGAPYGLRRAPRPDGYHAGTTDGSPILLGYVDVTHTGAAGGSVWLEVSTSGIVRSGGSGANDHIFFGFGEASGLLGNNFGARSSVADATVVFAAPGSPALSAPAAARYLRGDQNNTFSWGSAAGALTYTLQIDNNSGFGSPELEATGIAGTSRVVSAGSLPAGIYFWRVLAVNPGGSTASTPASRDFGMVPGCPGDVNSDGSVGVGDVAELIAHWATSCP